MAVRSHEPVILSGAKDPKMPDVRFEILRRLRDSVDGYRTRHTPLLRGGNATLHPPGLPVGPDAPMSA
jgi:hypothetical protein